MTTETSSAPTEPSEGTREGQARRKIAIAAVAPDSSAPISEYGGRAPAYLIFSADGELLETMVNPYKEAKEMVGIRVADLLNERGVEFFVAGEIGSRMREALEHRKIQYVEKSGYVKDVLENQVSAVHPASPEPQTPMVEITPERRWHMIAEAAFYRAESRGFVGGDPMEDWRAAEAEIDAQIAETQAMRTRQNEILQQTMDEATVALKMLSAAGSPRGAAAKQVELLKSALERTLVNMDELADMTAKSYPIDLPPSKS